MLVGAGLVCGFSYLLTLSHPPHYLTLNITISSPISIPSCLNPTDLEGFSFRNPPRGDLPQLPKLIGTSSLCTPIEFDMGGSDRQHS